VGDPRDLLLANSRAERIAGIRSAASTGAESSSRPRIAGVALRLAESPKRSDDPPPLGPSLVKQSSDDVDAGTATIALLTPDKSGSPRRLGVNLAGFRA
jgi:hypothetical protein